MESRGASSHQGTCAVSGTAEEDLNIAKLISRFKLTASIGGRVGFRPFFVSVARTKSSRVNQRRHGYNRSRQKEPVLL